VPDGRFLKGKVGGVGHRSSVNRLCNCPLARRSILGEPGNTADLGISGSGVQNNKRAMLMVLSGIDAVIIDSFPQQQDDKGHI
jgi:hypothetical protein